MDVLGFGCHIDDWSPIALFLQVNYMRGTCISFMLLLRFFLFPKGTILSRQSYVGVSLDELHRCNISILGKVQLTKKLLCIFHTNTSLFIDIGPRYDIDSLYTLLVFISWESDISHTNNCKGSQNLSYIGFALSVTHLAVHACVAWCNTWSTSLRKLS